MKKRTKKMTAAAVAAVMLFLIISICGCGRDAIPPLSVQTVTYEVVGSYPISYDVYVFSEGNIVHYDFNMLEHRFDYFNDPLPEDEYYKKKEFKMADGDWERIVNAVNDANFSELPEELNYYEWTDGETYYIEVKTEDSRYFSGGYLAGLGNSKDDRAYSEVREVLEAIAASSKLLCIPFL